MASLMRHDFFTKLNHLLRFRNRRNIFFIYTHNNVRSRFRSGLKANTEISYWCQSALNQAFSCVHFLKLQGEKDSRIRKITQQDVVIGHVGETYLKASERTRRLISFCPWVGHEDHSQEKYNCIPKGIERGLYDKAASLILLTSEFNKRHYLDAPRNDWYDYFQMARQKKRVRIVHQPIDLKVFERIKWEYATSNFFYIGSNAHMKDVPEARSLVDAVSRKLYLYGVEGDFFSHLDPVRVAALPSQADFFIQHGMWEAQCVSILEEAARGFIPIVTPETGYPYEHPFLLKFGDREYNLKRLKELLRTSEQERNQLADHLYLRLSSDQNHNTWSTLTDVLIEEVKRIL